MNLTEPLLVDASVWIAAINREDDFHRSAAALVLDERRAVAALDLTLYEVGNAVGARDGKRENAAYLNRLVVERCGQPLIRVDPDLIDAATEIAAEHSLTAYDAAYVAAARRGGMTLVSADLRDLVGRGLAVAPDAAV